MPQVISPSAFMTGNAPGGANYAAPLVNFQQLAQLPEDYYRGTQEARTLALQKAFPDGLPTLADGSPDIGSITKTLTQLGGAEAAQSLLPTLIDWQTGKQVADYMRQSNGGAAGVPPVGPAGGGGPSAGAPPPRSPIPGGPNAGPGNIVGNRPQLQQPQQPMAEEGGAPSIRSMATELAGGRNVSGPIDSYSRMSGIDPDYPLTVQQQQAFRTWFGKFVPAIMGASAQNQPRNEDPSSSGAPTTDTSAQDRQINGVSGAPFAGGGTNGAPGPVPGPVPVAPNAAGGALPNPAAALVPPGVDPLVRAGQFQQKAAEMRSVGALLMRGTNPERGKALLSQADAFDGYAGRILDAIKAGAEPTGTMKESAAAGYGANIPAYTAAGKNLEFTPEQKQYASYQAAGGTLPFDQWQVQQKGAVAGAEAGSRVAAENIALTPEQKLYAQYRQSGGTLPFDQWQVQQKGAVAGSEAASRVAAENKALTPEQKQYAQYQSTGGTLPFDQWQVQQKGEVAGREARERQEAEAFTKQHQGITAAGASADAMVPYLKLAQGFMSDPNFYSGPLENLNLKYKQAIASLGGDPNKAVPQEGFRKIVAEALGLQINNLKAAAAAAGMQSSRIFQSQLGIMRESQQNPESTVAANRTVTEIMLRAANLSHMIADMADTYKGGHLDSGFNIQLRRFLESPQGQLFTPEEIADTRRIAPPVVKSPADWQRSGLTEGTPFRTPDGRVLTHAPRMVAPPAGLPVQ